MVTLHHLRYSRSTRILWLLEAIGMPYELVIHDRGPDFRAPAALKAVHPLGKAPAIVDGELVLAESSAILRYLDRRYADGRFSPATGTDAAAKHDDWLDFVEGSAGLPIMMTMLGRMMGGLSAPLDGFAAAELRKTLDYLDGGVASGPYLMGDALTLADIQLSFLLELLSGAGALAEHPALAAYLDRLKREPGLIRAIEIGGPMTPRG